MLLIFGEVLWVWPCGGSSMILLAKAVPAFQHWNVSVTMILRYVLSGYSERCGNNFALKSNPKHGCGTVSKFIQLWNFFLQTRPPTPPHRQHKNTHTHHLLPPHKTAGGKNLDKSKPGLENSSHLTRRMSAYHCGPPMKSVFYYFFIHSNILECQSCHRITEHLYSALWDCAAAAEKGTQTHALIFPILSNCL